jgi:hypothetical protein
VDRIQTVFHGVAGYGIRHSGFVALLCQNAARSVNVTGWPKTLV